MTCNPGPDSTYLGDVDRHAISDVDMATARLSYKFGGRTGTGLAAIGYWSSKKYLEVTSPGASRG